MAAQREWPQSFADRLIGPMPKISEVARSMWARDPQWAPGEAERIPVLHAGLPPLGSSDTAITWVGHATYLVRTTEAAVLIDPVWSEKITGAPRRITSPGVAFSDLPPIDAVAITHDHYDHLDAATLRRLPRSTPMLVPGGLGRWFRRRGFTEVVEFDWGESAQVGSLAFDFVPARHWSRRGLRDTCRTLWGGWVITTPQGRRLYHAGDTGYGPHFREIGRQYAPIDIAMVPIGAYAPRSAMHLAHMAPEEAVRAALDTGAAYTASMHWGTFVLTKEPLMEPWELLCKAWREAGSDPAQLWDLAVGETRMLP